MKRSKPTEAELAWAMYLTVPDDLRLVASYAEMTAEARRTWLVIAKRHLAAGGDLKIEGEAKVATGD